MKRNSLQYIAYSGSLDSALCNLFKDIPETFSDLRESLIDLTPDPSGFARELYNSWKDLLEANNFAVERHGALITLKNAKPCDEPSVAPSDQRPLRKLMQKLRMK